MSKSYIDTLWTDCLFEIMIKAKAEGRKTIEFKEVDALVIEKSKTLPNQPLDSDGKKPPQVS